MNELIKEQLNFLMNHFLQTANQMKASAADFYSSNDYGFYCFLKAEMMEQYEYADCISDFLLKNDNYAVIYTALPAPTHGPPNVQTLQRIADLIKAGVDVMADLMISADYQLIHPFLYKLHQQQVHEHNEMLDVIDTVTKLGTDESGMLMYNNYLKNKYNPKSKYGR